MWGIPCNGMRSVSFRRVRIDLNNTLIEASNNCFHFIREI
jgi:hypothetical protein